MANSSAGAAGAAAGMPGAGRVRRRARRPRRRRPPRRRPGWRRPRRPRDRRRGPPPRRRPRAPRGCRSRSPRAAASAGRTSARSGTQRQVLQRLGVEAVDGGARPRGGPPSPGHQRAPQSGRLSRARRSTAATSVVAVGEALGGDRRQRRAEGGARGELLEVGGVERETRSVLAAAARGSQPGTSAIVAGPAARRDSPGQQPHHRRQRAEEPPSRTAWPPRSHAREARRGRGSGSASGHRRGDLAEPAAPPPPAPPSRRPDRRRRPAPAPPASPAPSPRAAAAQLRIGVDERREARLQPHETRRVVGELRRRERGAVGGIAGSAPVPARPSAAGRRGGRTVAVERGGRGPRAARVGDARGPVVGLARQGRVFAGEVERAGDRVGAGRERHLRAELAEEGERHRPDHPVAEVAGVLAERRPAGPPGPPPRGSGPRPPRRRRRASLQRGAALLRARPCRRARRAPGSASHRIMGCGPPCAPRWRSRRAGRPGRSGRARGGAR